MPKAGKDKSKGENIPGCGRVFPERGSGIWPKYSAEFGKRERDTYFPRDGLIMHAVGIEWNGIEYNIYSLLV